MSTEWHFIITDGAEVVPIAELPSRPDVVAELRGVMREAIGGWARRLVDHVLAAFAPAAEAFAEVGRQIVEAFGELGQALVAAVIPAFQALRATLTSWWRGLPPSVRAWARRRVRYGALPVTGPPRRALLLAPVRRL